MTTKKDLRKELETAEAAIADLTEHVQQQNDTIKDLRATNKSLNETIQYQNATILDLTNANDDLHAKIGETRDAYDGLLGQIEKLLSEKDELNKRIENQRRTIAELQNRLRSSDAVEQSRKKPERTETQSGNRCEIEDTTGYSAKEIDAMHLRQALRILDEGGFVPQDKKGNVWNKAYILCLITEKGSQTYAAGTEDEYRTMFSGLFAAAKQNKGMDKALMLVQVLDMLQRKLTGAGKPEEAGDGNA